MAADPTGFWDVGRGLCSRGRPLGKIPSVWSLTVKLLLATLHKSVIYYRKESQNRLGVCPGMGEMVAEACLRWQLTSVWWQIWGTVKGHRRDALPLRGSLVGDPANLWSSFHNTTSCSETSYLLSVFRASTSFLPHFPSTSLVLFFLM